MEARLRDEWRRKHRRRNVILWSVVIGIALLITVVIVASVMSR